MESDVFIPRQPVHITLKFENMDEVEHLLAELTIWTPTSGWGESAQEFFDILRTAIDLHN